MVLYKKKTIKVHDSEEEKEGILNYSDPSSQKYAAVSGYASIENDKLKMLTQWNSTLQSWFPKRLSDPELVMIKVEMESAEIWDSPPCKTVKLLGMAKSIVAGQHY